MAVVESKGLVLFVKKHKEKDKLVKIFTESAGKQMFYVRNAIRKNNPLTTAIMPYTEATFIGTFNQEGLSFLNEAKYIHPYQSIQQDIFLAGYATYMLNLADAAIEDRGYDPHLYHFLAEALRMIDEKIDAEIVTNIFEVQILQRFGVELNWQHCAICGETKGAFDFSTAYHGVLCQRHWSNDERRYHASPKAIHFLRMFHQINYQQISSIQVADETKQEIRRVLDEIYDEYVGIHLKSKSFIDQMKSWQGVLKSAPDEKNKEDKG